MIQVRIFQEETKKHLMRLLAKLRIEIRQVQKNQQLVIAATICNGQEPNFHEKTHVNYSKLIHFLHLIIDSRLIYTNHIHKLYGRIR
jgi:hypothetical protein